MNQDKSILENLLRDKEIKLKQLNEEHRKAIAVYEATDRMLRKDIHMFENLLAEQKQK